MGSANRSGGCDTAQAGVGFPPKIIYIAIDAQATHIYEKGLREHIRNALKLDATSETLIEIFALISAMDITRCRSA